MEPQAGTVWLDAKGEATVKFSSLLTTCMAVGSATPRFVLGPSVSVTIDSSMISGNIAKLTGSAKGPPTWLQLNNCRIRYHSDPRTDIECDEYSGFEIRNCQVENEFIHLLTHLPGVRTTRQEADPSRSGEE